MKTHDLTIGYEKDGKSNILFANQSLVLNQGELVCFMGPNGIGKSTLIRTLAGLQTPLSGKIHCDKEHNIAVVLTDRLTASNLTVYDLVSYGRYPFLDWSLSLKEKDKVLIQQAIDQVHIQHLVNQKIVELSDGQLQMALIAKALAQDTDILLLDEPTAHLDLNNRVEIMNLLRTISRTENKAILIATHELDLALQTSDVIWLATADKKIKTGIPEDLVLDESFDEVFKFKGFDLKTGKVYHEAFRNQSVNLAGTGHEYLWTKNALERSGYSVRPDAVISIAIQPEEGTWILSNGQQSSACKSIAELLGTLSKF